ncbi:hypothetical protein M407DRAFT_242771 [Tulasnella calospora MUT 4182]|uniref:Uncharacterized protein n=1 Tax=Tulasnella calospora MUT 4182 TaxID=1051891 RepID=A0A0C3L5J9_9AGAM|nr:hypothetical protein M407DRAFT_242771 [Tulasnella calospora MUT 4182]
MSRRSSPHLYTGPGNTPSCTLPIHSEHQTPLSHASQHSRSTPLQGHPASVDHPTATQRITKRYRSDFPPDVTSLCLVSRLGSPPVNDGVHLSLRLSSWTGKAAQSGRFGGCTGQTAKELSTDDSEFDRVLSWVVHFLYVAL